MPRRFVPAAVIVTLIASLSVAVVTASGAAATPPARNSVMSTALSGTATASSHASGHAPTAALDTDPATSWQAARRGAAWLQLDLGSLRSVSGVQVDFAATDVWMFGVEGSLDGRTWVGLDDRTHGAAGVSFARSTTGLYRWVRLSVAGSESDRVAAVREFRVLGDQPVSDLVPGASLTSSSHADGYEATRAADGNTSTYWKASSATMPQWLQVDLGRPTTLTGLQQDFIATGVYSFTISGSVNGSSWTRLASYTAARGHSFASAVDRVRYRYLRLEVTSAADGQWASSSGLSAFGYRDLTPTGTTVASGAADGHPATSAVDGDTSTEWQARNTGVQWVRTDLGHPQWIDSLRIAFPDDMTRRYRLQVSDDGTTWTTVRDAWGGRSGRSATAAVAGCHRWVRAVVVGSASQPAALTEFAVLGTEVTRNLAVGTKVTTSTNAGEGWEPGFAVDGDPDSYWLASSASYDSPQWITADLGHLAQISSVGFSVHDSDVWKFAVDASVDGANWTTLLDASDGRTGRNFTTTHGGMFRYVRITQTGSGAAHWANVGELSVMGIGSPVTTRWFDETGSVFRIFPKDLPYTSIRTVIDRLPELRRQGYTAVEMAPPYAGADRADSPDYFAGLGATDNYAIDPRIGTMADWRELIATAHAMGMRVIEFHNLGYADVTAPFFAKAVADFRAGVDSTERGWFLLSDHSGGDRWYEYENTGVWYYAYWGVHDPTYNWNGTWPAEAAKILTFWADTGIDGMFLDAPPAYYGFDQAKNNVYITDVLRNYGIATMAEGLQPTAPPQTMQPQTTFTEWVQDWHYNTIQDLWIEHWGNPAYSRIVFAAEDQDASTLDPAMRMSRDLVTSVGGITLSSASWPLDYDGGTQQVVPSQRRPVDERLLEASTLTTMGTLNYLINAADWMHPDTNPDEILSWTDQQRDSLARIYRAQGAYAALGQTGARIALPTASDSALAYLRRDTTGGTAALVVQNFQSTPQAITVDLANAGIGSPQTPTDLLSGKAGPRIASTSYTLTLPAHGYLELGVH